MATAIEQEIIQDSETWADSKPTSGARAKGEMLCMDASGDTKVEWDEDNDDEVNAARTMFDGLIKKGYSAFRVSRLGKKGERVTSFDPTAEKLIMVPALQGG